METVLKKYGEDLRNLQVLKQRRAYQFVQQLRRIPQIFDGQWNEKNVLTPNWKIYDAVTTKKGTNAVDDKALREYFAPNANNIEDVAKKQNYLLMVKRGFVIYLKNLIKYFIFNLMRHIMNYLRDWC